MERKATVYNFAILPNRHACGYVSRMCVFFCCMSLLISYFVPIFSNMGILLKGFLPTYIKFQTLVNFLLSIFGLTVLIACPAETPIVIGSIKVSLLNVKENLSLRRCNRCLKGLKIKISTILKRDVFAFSAYHTVYFKRSMIITCYGAVSYGLLLHQLN